MLSNIDLENLATSNGIQLVGVFSKDELPRDLRKTGNYIINLQDANDGGGTHWTAFKILNTKQACYFDSFGFLPPKEVSHYLELYKPYAVNNRQVQDVKSDYCGYFCLAFLKVMEKPTEHPYELFDDFLNEFTNNLKTNDKLAVDILKRK